jgi:hypothetical protein
LATPRSAATEAGPASEAHQDLADDHEMSEDRDMIDEEAIEQFGRDLDGLGESEVATQALEEDEAASASAPF